MAGSRAGARVGGQLIDARTRELILATERFHARLKRLDAGWRERDPAQPSAIAALRERLGAQVRG